jgi:hypothetical protein
MRFEFQPAVAGVKDANVDAYSFLGILLRTEGAYGGSWKNRFGQRLTTKLLLQNVRDHYFADHRVGDEEADHTHLHMVELLLEFARRYPGALDPGAVKSRFLAAELQRDAFGSEGPAEALGHYAESLGLLLREPSVQWSTSERRQVRTWLRDLEAGGYFGPETPINYVAHLLRGLRLIDDGAGKLQ